MKGLYEIQRENELKAVKAVVECYQRCIKLGVDGEYTTGIDNKLLERLREVFKLND